MKHGKKNGIDIQYIGRPPLRLRDHYTSRVQNDRNDIKTKKSVRVSFANAQIFALKSNSQYSH